MKTNKRKLESTETTWKGIQDAHAAGKNGRLETQDGVKAGRYHAIENPLI